MTNIVTWLTTYAAHVDGHHRAQLLAAADEIANLRAQVAELKSTFDKLRNPSMSMRRAGLEAVCIPLDGGDGGYLTLTSDEARDVFVSMLDAAMPTVAPSPHAISAVTGQTLAG